VNEGVNFTPRGQISPLGAKFTLRGEIHPWGPGVKLRMALWGSTTDNVRGKLFEEFIIENGMEIHNQASQPTFQTIRAGRTIDTAREGK
jgi:hypothetical protein